MLLLLASLALQHPSPRPPDLAKRAHTYSIVAYDSASGDLGVAVQSKFPNVGGIVPWAQAGVGAVATQSLGNTDYGEKGLELLARGATAPEAPRTDKRGMEAAALLVVRKNAGYLGSNDRYIDIRVYDDTNPIRELERLYELHKLYFFTSRPEDLIPITPDVVRRLEPILLREPRTQPEKWLAAPQGVANRTFLEALANFMYWENYDVRVRMDGKIDRVALDDILKRRKP